MRAYVVRIVPAAPGALERPEQLSVSLMKLARGTPSSFITPLNVRMPTVLDAMSYHVKMDEYWWTLAKIIVAGRFQDGKYTLPSGITVYEQEPQVFLEEQENALQLALKSLESKTQVSQAQKKAQKAQKELEKMEKSIRSLEAAVKTKGKEVAKLVRTETVVRTQEKNYKGQAKELLKKSEPIFVIFIIG